MASSHASAPSAAAGASRPRRNKDTSDLLRNYYGLPGEGNGRNGQRDKDTGNTLQSRPARDVAPDADMREDPRNPDSGRGFLPEVAFRHLLQTQTLAQLLRQESTLLTEIRELDGERQSLVYNHHHELVAASETMKSMKERADDLMPGLGSLQSSMQAIAQISESVQRPAQAGEMHAALADDFLLNKAAPVIALPQRMRDLIALDGPDAGVAKAQSLWGSMEAVLAAWDEASVSGARDIMAECRHVLREGQQASTTSPT